MLLKVSDLFPFIAKQIKKVMNVINSVLSFSYHCKTNKKSDECY